MLNLPEKLSNIRQDICEEYLSKDQNYPWIIGFSAGKDSTALLQLTLEAILDLAPDERTRPVHILINDTLVESPIYEAHMSRVIKRIESALPALDAPITINRVVPGLDQTFWVNLIGRGYPSPNRQFRWCTDRMKIAPTNDFIKSIVSENGQTILLLGVRRDESSQRSKSIDRYNLHSSRLNPHNSLSGCLVYRPIVDITTDELWMFLLQVPPPWGGSHRDLVTLYRNLSGGECPLVLDRNDAPSCGTSSYRFGCWTCTVVQKDRSMAAQIDAGHEWLEPLMEFRDYLFEIRNDPTYRDEERRNGQRGPGPFTVSARKEILERLLEVQNEVGMSLISENELMRIRQIWTEDLVAIGQRRFAIENGK